MAFGRITKIFRVTMKIIFVSVCFLPRFSPVHREGWSTSDFHYEKCDSFNYPIINLPFKRFNVPYWPAYGNFISQPKGYDWACSSYECFIRGQINYLVYELLRRDTSLISWHRHSWHAMLDMGILLHNIKSPSHKCYMTFWSLTSYSDSLTDQTLHKWTWYWT